MAKGINKVILIGNCGADPDVRQTATGSSVTVISIATSEAWTDKQTGQPQERTEWHRVVFLNRLAEIAAQYLRKGSKVFIEGSLRTRKWDDQSGQTRYTTEIVAREMQMLDSRNAEQQQDSYQPANQQKNNRQPPPQAAAPSEASNPADNFDDDIPF